jgi:hypothetical protein
LTIKSLMTILAFHCIVELVAKKVVSLTFFGFFFTFLHKIGQESARRTS